MIDFIICPLCESPIGISMSHCVCDKGHEFPVIQGIPDLLTNDIDGNIIEEQEHWDHVTEQGRLSVMPNLYMNARIHEDYRKEFHKCVKLAWPEDYAREVRIVDIGCGNGSAISYFEDFGFQKVTYFGIDVSMKSMQVRKGSGEHLPNNWEVHFLRSSANVRIFKEDSLDIVFSASALHHLDIDCVIKWISRSLKPNGLLILNEPSKKNVFAKIGRKLVHDFHTHGERPLLPSTVTQIGYENGLTLVYEKGLHNLVGPLHYLVGMRNSPQLLTAFLYNASSFLDTFITSPSWNYSFVQAYIKNG